MAKKFQSNGYDPYPTHPSAGGDSSVSVILYQHLSESAPLLPGRRERRGISTSRLCQVGSWCLAFFIFSSMVYHTSMHFMRCPLDPSTRDAIRQDWEKEEAQHAVLEREWRRRTQEHAEIEQDWKRATERHDNEVTRRIHEEHVRQARVREEWAREMERHTREYEEMQRREREEREREAQEHQTEVARRTHEEEERQERVRKRWAQEAEQHRHKFEEMERREKQRQENERQKWQREVEDHDRIEEERRKREEEDRQKLNMFWGRVEAHTCTTYATREYTAQLMNLPSTWEHRVDSCKATPLEIHGISYLPKSCEDRGPGVVTGRWEINQQEPDCTTFWDGYNDKGCTSPGSGKRHITHKLENLPEGSDWREFCATTPISFNHMQFPGAEECFPSTWGVYGRWEVDDSKC